MSWRRLGTVFFRDLAHHAKRPLFWMLVLILVFNAWGLSRGSLQINSGDSDVGGMKSFINSEFAFSQQVAILFMLFYGFFVAVGSGMLVIQDEEWKAGELLHATPLRPSEYIWGKFLAVLAAFVALLGLQALLSMLFNQVLQDPARPEIFGPFLLRAYLRPTFYLALPTLVFIAGTTFAVGERTRKPVLVFLLPVALLLACVFFLWQWSPAWLGLRWNHLLMWADPAGYRWLDETWLKVDRGVAFYNHERVAYDTPFLLSRLAFVALGLGSVAWSQRRFAAELKGRRVKAEAASQAVAQAAAADESPAAAPAPSPLAALGMRARQPGLFQAVRDVAKFELKGLFSQPGLYLFIPLILLQTIGTSLTAYGAFSTPLLLTSGTMAASSMNTLTLLVCLLLLFYTVESLNRESNHRLEGIAHSTPISTASLLTGKALANSCVGALVVAANGLACAVILLIQGRVGLELKPFLLVWGLLLIPTFLLWTAFINLVQAFTGNRYGTYALALGALILSGWCQAKGHMNWAANWDLWSATRWSDLGTLELSRPALVLNRIEALGLAAAFTALAVRIYGRRQRDASATLGRLRFKPLAAATLRFLPFAAVPLAAGALLYVKVQHGYEGDAAVREARDYWRKNLLSYLDYPVPAITAVDMDLQLDPASHGFTVKGTFALKNHHDAALEKVLVSTGSQFRDIRWTVDGQEAKPEDRKGLWVFTPAGRGLEPGAAMTLGFSYHGRFPEGISKNGGGREDFILPSGAVLTSFTPDFAPVLGFHPEGENDPEHKPDPKEYSDRFYEGITETSFGSALPFNTRIRVTGPAGYTYNSVGTLAEDTVKDGRRSELWVSDAPVRFFNVVAGRWEVREGDGTAIYYSAKHPYNIAEMSAALGEARTWYGQWFHPYPWKTLKLSEFADHASYAQGFPTNITFSESIGFLTKSDPEADAAFMVTALESAHQWWGNIVTPGEGPGGNVLSEGMAHFSTALLYQQVKGDGRRMEFLKTIEEDYNDKRSPDSERPLVKLEGSRKGDSAATYDKGGWAAYMMMQLMGREACLAGLQDFIRQYADNPDHPVLQDFLRVMRTHAPDPAAFDAFAQQWYEGVVMPEYKFSEARCEPAPGGGWQVRFKVANVGTGRMPLELAATQGERYLVKGGAAEQPNPAYKEARTSTVLGAGESREITLSCAFKPERLVADPDVKVLQVRRKEAVAKL